MQRPPDRLAQKLDQWKADLVDLTATNPLLNFRPDGNAVRIVRPDAEPLLDRFRDSFEPVRLRLLADPTPEQTDVLVAAADRQSVPATLRLIRHRAVMASQQQGIHPLFLTFGHLRWRNRDDHKPIESPLLVLPVNLERATPFADYEVTPVGAAPDLDLNPALRVALQRDYDVDIGTLPVSLREDMLDDIIDHVRDQIAGHLGWAVEPAVHLALLPFDRFVMYEDLERNGPAFLSHPVLRALAGEAAHIAAAEPAPEVDGQSSHPSISTHVLDADTSQREAMRAVARGGSMIIQGPPGTGKSQTITNIIADALRRDRTVLFVSEKRAALDVVARRLHALGLGGAMLALHDDLADERAVMRALSVRTGMGLPDADLPATGADGERRDEVIGELVSLLRQIDSYYTALCDDVADIGQSTFDVIGRLAELRRLPRIPFNYDVGSAGSFTRKRIAEWLRTVEGLASVSEIVLHPEASPWRHVDTRRVTADPTNRYQLEGRLRELTHDASSLADLMARVARKWGLPAGANRESARWLAEVLETGEPLVAASVPADWFRQDVRDRVARRLEESRARNPEREAARQRLETRYGTALRDPELLARLDEHLGIGRPSRLRVDPGLVPPDDLLTTPALDRHARFMLALVLAAAERVRESADDVAQALDLIAPSSWNAAIEFQAFVDRIGREPRPLRSWYGASDNARLRELAEAACERANALRERAAFLTRFRPGIFDVATDEAIGNLVEPDDSFWDRIVALVRWDIGRVEGQLHRQAALGREEALDALRAARAMREAEGWFAEHDAELHEAFGAHYHGWETPWSELVALLDHVRRAASFLERSGDPPASLTNLSYGVLDVNRQLADLREALALLDSARAGLSAIAPAELRPLIGELETRSLEDVIAEIDETWLLGYDDLASDARTLSRLREVPWDEPGDIVRDIHDAGETAARQAELAELLGTFARDGVPQWAEVATALARVDALRARFPQGAVPPRLVELLAASRIEPGVDARTLREAIRQVDQARDRLDPFFDGEPHLADDAFDLSGLPDMAAWAGGLFDRLPELNRYLMSRHLVEQAREQGIHAFIDAVREANLPPPTWRDAFEHQLYTLWMSARLGAAPGIRMLGVDGADALQERFAALDRELLALNARHLAAALAEDRASALDAEDLRPGIASLRAAASARSPETLRSLFTDAPGLMQALAPCLLMTPRAVARLLGTSPLRFDVVIFDEASQIVPEDAIGSIGRGQQIVVVGDSQQLPPTDFFTANGDAQAWKPESLLELCTVSGLPNTWLQWHYRSRHDDLIAFSNAEFYDNNLVTFPSPSRLDDPVRFVRVDDGVYGRGTGRTTNPREAEIVIDLLAEHAERYPDQSVGVIAFSEAQMTEIEDALQKRRASAPPLDRFLAAHVEEPLFVRNLENVQGDERDAIFMSVGYGPDRFGSMSLHFGPLNRDGGARRLNVAITRARRQMTIVASFDPARLADANAEGVKLLRRYLIFAKASGEELAPRANGPDGKSSPSSLVDVIASEIAAAGYHVERRVGRGKSRIDIGVKQRPDSPRYLLGIEVDGSVRDMAPDARDRERLRPAVLHGLGWNLYRVWSAAWQYDPDRALKRLLDRIGDVARAQRATAAQVPAYSGIVDDLTGEDDEGGFGIDWEAGGPSAPMVPTAPEPTRGSPTPGRDAGRKRPKSPSPEPEAPRPPVEPTPEAPTTPEPEPPVAPSEPEPEPVAPEPEAPRMPIEPEPGPDPETPVDPATPDPEQETPKAPAPSEPGAPEEGGETPKRGRTRRARSGDPKKPERKRPLDAIKGLNAGARKKLERAGIASTAALLAATETERQHRALAKKLGVAEGELTDWVNRADLMRVSGIGEQFANLLERAGVASCRELRHRNPDNLLETLKEANDAHGLVTRLPARAQVGQWIERAKAVIEREDEA
jgi:hypothetical protein